MRILFSMAFPISAGLHFHGTIRAVFTKERRASAFPNFFGKQADDRHLKVSRDWTCDARNTSGQNADLSGKSGGLFLARAGRVLPAEPGFVLAGGFRSLGGFTSVTGSVRLRGGTLIRNPGKKLPGWSGSRGKSGGRSLLPKSEPSCSTAAPFAELIPFRPPPHGRRWSAAKFTFVLRGV